MSSSRYTFKCNPGKPFMELDGILLNKATINTIYYRLGSTVIDNGYRSGYAARDPEKSLMKELEDCINIPTGK